jgi:hypothetical protein
MNTNIKNPKKPLNYICKNCNFNTRNKKDYLIYLSTDNYILLINPN